MPLSPEQKAAFDELKRRGSLTPDQVDAFDELSLRESSPYSKATGRAEPAGFSKTSAQLQKEIRQQQVGEENAANESWLPAIGTGGAAVVRTAGGMIPGGPLASEPLAQLYENVAGTRQGFSKGLVAGETALSMIPGGKIAQGVSKLAPRLGKTGAQMAEHAVMGEAATALPAAIEGQPYTPGLGAAGGVALGAAAKGVGKIIPEGIGARIGTKVEQAVAPRTERSKKLVYDALSEGISPRTVKAQRLEKELSNGLEPVFDFAAMSKRKINGMEDIKNAAKDMVRVTDAEFNPAVERVGDRMVSGKPVAQAIRDEITDLVRMQNPAQAEGLERLAASFDRDMPIREVNQLRKEITGKLDNWYSKSPQQREHSPLGVEADSAMADGLRNVLYDNLEQIFPDAAIRQRMRERGAAEGIYKFASESSGAAQRGTPTNVRGPITTPLTLGAKATKTVFSPTETAKKVAKFAQRPDRKISEAYKLYIPKKSTISAPIGKPGLMERERQLGPSSTVKDPSGPTIPNIDIAPSPYMPPLPARGSQFEQQPGGGYRFRDLTQQALEYGKTQNVLSPHFQPNPLLDRDVVAQSRAQAAQGPSRPLPPELENMTIGDYLRFRGLDVKGNFGTASEFIDNALRTQRNP